MTNISHIFEAKNVIVQGITGAHGRFQTQAMRQAGTTIVAGVTPGKGGKVVDGVPVYNTIEELQQQHTVDVSVIFVPAQFAKQAIFEAIDARIPLVVCITEGIPIHDMLQINERLRPSATTTLLGPNSPGVILPGIHSLGIIPAAFSLPGSLGIVSRSGTLTYETMAGLRAKGIGQRYVIGIGGDSIHGLGYRACLQLFQDDPLVDRIVFIGEIGGQEEIEAALFIKEHVTKPVFAYIAGHHAPTGLQLGHAGAILGSKHESAAAKSRVLSLSGVTTAKSIDHLISLVADE